MTEPRKSGRLVVSVTASGYQRMGYVSIASSVYPVSESLLHVGPWLPMLSLTGGIVGSRMRANISSASSDYIE